MCSTLSAPAFVLAALLLGLLVSCGPSDAELAALVQAEVERQVALIPPAPQGDTGQEGAQGPQGVEGSQGLIGPQGTQGQTGPQGPQGATGPQGPSGRAGSTGLQGPKGDPGPAGPAGAPGSSGNLEIPKILEVEQLIIRKSHDDQYITINAGTATETPSIRWHFSSGVVASVIQGASTEGLVLSDNTDSSEWTSFCIGDRKANIC